MSFDVERYLQRIGLGGEVPPVSRAGLERLQAAQMRAITFENIAPFLGMVPDLSPEALWQKLVLSGRGGYCFELNGLFAQALAALGFPFQPMLARVRMGASVGGPRSHHCFIVTVEEREWLVDTGFGGPAPAGPLELGTEQEQVVAGIDFRIVRDSATGEAVLERRSGDGWLSLYGFDRAPVAPPDYEAANFVCARWEQSQFPYNLMVARATDAGRISMRNLDLRIIEPAGEQRRTLTSREELAGVLQGPFALALDDAVLEAIWQRLVATQPASAKP